MRHTDIFCLVAALVLSLAVPFPAQAQGPAIGPALDSGTDSAQDAAERQDIENRLLSVYEDSIIDTGINRGEIPAIDRPVYISVEDASLALDPEDPVFILEHSDPVYIFPQPVMVWHEVVNETMGGEPVSITYSPLTGSVVGYKGEVGLFTTSFGVTGRLLNNGTVLYDRSTNSLWPQVLGQAVDGPLLGETLERFPLTWGTWGRARDMYPDARVLSSDTGYHRTYGRDPYGSYSVPSSYYHNNMVVYPVTTWDDRLPPKERMLCLLADQTPVAVLKSKIKELGVVNFDTGIIPMAAFYDPDLDTVRVFDRRWRNRVLTFRFLENAITDEETRSTWNGQGMAIDGVAETDRLAPIDAFDSMWFAWAAFYPDSRVIPSDDPFVSF
ncbi:MAG: DUF3179 domain-containing protein [Desulfovibrio sp.]|nr:MAG: DUF3179 domain-containing protein [Desulfovibrio sp.]